MESNLFRNSDEECPSYSFEQGKPNGKCWGDGHYLCAECKNYRTDFKKYGQEYIDGAHNSQTGLIITTLK